MEKICPAIRRDTKMLKKRDLQDSHVLFELMSHPDVFPFVRQKAYSYDEFVFVSKQTIEAEERGELISRTILDDWGAPIGTINLFDIQDGAGFLGTWIGKPYHGKGYNAPAKDAFFQEVFYEKYIETIFMRIRKENIRSIKAAEKLPYVVKANDTRKMIYEQLNANGDIYDLYEIPKDQYSLYLRREMVQVGEDSQRLEA
jgi:RimJ/RimL family protein N-acetyltransferase